MDEWTDGLANLLKAAGAGEGAEMYLADTIQCTYNNYSNDRNDFNCNPNQTRENRRPISREALASILL